MDEILSLHSRNIHSLRAKIVTHLEKERPYGCRLAPLRQAGADLAQLFHSFLETIEAAHTVNASYLNSVIPFIENAYLDWRAVQAECNETLRLAYRDAVPSSNLSIDIVLAEMERVIGDPLLEAYARLQSSWLQHLDSHPWDAHVSDTGGHLDADHFQDALRALGRGDEFDIEDATENLTGPYRHLLSHHLNAARSDGDALARISSNLWKRPEIVVANDYWQERHRSRITDFLLSKTDTPPAVGFARIKEFFSQSSNSARDNQKIVSFLREIAYDDREKFLRCLTLHPDQGIRRYAVTNIGGGSFWKSLTPSMVPCSTILSLLERVVGSQQFDDNFRKIFFDAVFKRLLTLTSRSEVLYARGIVRIFTQLDFFLEDVYFEKLMRLLTYIESKENYFKIKTPVLDDHLAALKTAKQRTGSLETASPEFSVIPPVALRKLAKEGHFWFELSMHPIYKIAKETIPYINSRDRAIRVVSQKNANQDVIRAIGKNKALFASHSSMMALLTNPRTPPAVSMEYLSELSRPSIETLLRKSTIHAEFRRQLLLKLRASQA
jgi:hypothetical protein